MKVKNVTPKCDEDCAYHRGGGHTCHMKTRKESNYNKLEKCKDCKGTGRMFAADSSGAWLDYCETCIGTGDVPPQHTPNQKFSDALDVDPTMKTRKCSDVNFSSEFGDQECQLQKGHVGNHNSQHTPKAEGSVGQHTPGPWKNVVAKRNNGSVYYEIKQTTLALDPNIAICDSARDARLIAAAPELLEAAKNARNVLAALAVGDLSVLSIKADSPALLSLRAAIAKAEGK